MHATPYFRKMPRKEKSSQLDMDGSPQLTLSPKIRGRMDQQLQAGARDTSPANVKTGQETGFKPLLDDEIAQLLQDDQV